MSKKAFSLGVESLESKKLLSITPNDPYYYSQWGLNNISASAAWQYSTGSKNVVVAVIDSGSDLTNQDLVDNLWTNPGEIPGDGIDNEGDGYVDDVYGWNFADNNPDIQDRYGHGTHVAGIIGAKGGNSMGVAGVNWNVSIMTLKFMSDRGIGSTSAALASMNYIAKMKELYNVNVVAVNASWQSYGYTSLVYDALNRLNNDGILFVTAAGNSSSNNDITPEYPSCYDLDNVISVGALSNDGHSLAELSNYGSTSVDLAAPGIMIKSTLPYNSYGDLSGTSMASPFVAGAAALLKAAKPDLNMIQIKGAIFGSVDRIPELFGKVATGGKLNVGAAVSNVLGIPYSNNTNSSPVGSITNSSMRSIGGWARDPDSNISIKMQLIIDGKVKSILNTRASDGAFSFNLGGLSVGDHVIEVKAMDTQTGEWCSIGTVDIKIPAPTVGVSFLSTSAVRGWAYSERSGSSPVIVKVLVNGRLVGTQWANQRNADMPNHGFRVSLNRNWFRRGTNEVVIRVYDPISKQTIESWKGSVYK